MISFSTNFNKNEKFAITELFDTDSENFKKYCNIVFDPKNTELKIKKGITHKHHIIPKMIFKHYNIKIDNSKTNIINLYIKDHILAHYYLALSAKKDWLQYGLDYAFFTMTKEHINNIEETKLLMNLPSYTDLFIQYNRLNSERQSKCVGSKSTTGGRICIYNSQLNKKKYILPEHLSYWLNEQNGWIQGGIPQTDKAKKQIGQKNAISLLGHKSTIEANKKRSNTLKQKWQDPNSGWNLPTRKKRSKESYIEMGKKIAGKKCISSKLLNKRIRVPADEVAKYLANGWELGWGEIKNEKTK